MAIRDQGYSLYDGDLSQGTAPALVIATNEFWLAWGYLRTKLLFIVMMVIPVLFIVVSFGERALTKFLLSGQAGAGVEADKISGFFDYSMGTVEVWMLAVMLAATGCGVIADDMRHRTVQLYFSKPITRVDYVLGKFLGLVFIGSLVTFLPLVMVMGVRLALFAPSDSFGVVAYNAGMLVVFSGALLVSFSLFVMALSCLTSQRGLVMLMWLGAMIVPKVVETIASAVRQGEDWTTLLSLSGALGSALQVMVGFEGLPDPGAVGSESLPGYLGWGAWGLIVVLVAASLGVIHWRTSRLEGIA